MNGYDPLASLFLAGSPKLTYGTLLLEGHLTIYPFYFLPDSDEAVTIAPHNHITLSYSNHYMTESLSLV